ANHAALARRKHRASLRVVLCPGVGEIESRRSGRERAHDVVCHARREHFELAVSPFELRCMSMNERRRTVQSATQQKTAEYGEACAKDVEPERDPPHSQTKAFDLDGESTGVVGVEI